MARFTLPRDIYHGKGAFRRAEELKKVKRQSLLSVAAQ